MFRIRSRRKLSKLSARQPLGSASLFVLVGLVIVAVGVGIAWLVLRGRGVDPASIPLLAEVTRGTYDHIVLEEGEVESSNNVEIRSKVWGWKTVNWVIESGSDVKQGDLLVELDASEMEKKVDDAKINYHNARADMITAESNVTVAEKSSACRVSAVPRRISWTCSGRALRSSLSRWGAGSPG